MHSGYVHGRCTFAVVSFLLGRRTFDGMGISAHPFFLLLFSFSARSLFHNGKSTAVHSGNEFFALWKSSHVITVSAILS